MISLSTDQQTQFRQAVFEASGNADLRRAVGNLYIALQDAINLQKPVCDRSGRCCRFDEYGHRLFVTTAEVATFLSDLPPAFKSPIENQKLQILPGCPFQESGLCSVHCIRPLGCRIFFCDPSTTDWQQQQYERFHHELRRLHQRWDIPYFYVEWREALRCFFPDQ